MPSGLPPVRLWTDAGRVDSESGRSDRYSTCVRVLVSECQGSRPSSVAASRLIGETTTLFLLSSLAEFSWSHTLVQFDAKTISAARAGGSISQPKLCRSAI